MQFAAPNLAPGAEQRRTRHRLSGLFLAGLLLTAGLRGEETRVDFIYPAGGQVGTEVALSVAGRFSSWPLAVWTDDPGLRIVAADAPGHFQAVIATNIAVGPHLIRFHDDSGASAPWQFVVGDLPEQVAAPESEEGLEPLPVPCAQHGQLRSPGEIHTWRFAAAGPVTLEFDAAATRLDSPATLGLRLLDADGTVLGESTNPPPADPELRCLLVKEGAYRLEVRRRAAAPASEAEAPVVYRLKTTTAAPAAAAALVPRGTLFESAPLPDLSSRVIIREAPEPPPEPVLHPETLSPSDGLAGTFGGFINPGGDEDRFSFVARREEVHRYRVRKMNPESEFLPVVRVRAAGEVLAESAPGLDSTLEWTAPADGTYTLVVADARGAGGPDFAYELELAPPEPRVAAVTRQHTFTLAPGGRLEVAIAISRPDAYRGVLTVTAAGLPADVTAGSAILAPDTDTAVLELHAADDARLFSGPFRLLVLDPVSSPPRTFAVTAPLQGRHAPPGGMLVNETDTFWLTVRP
jgi:hypothetical protein